MDIKNIFSVELSEFPQVTTDYRIRGFHCGDYEEFHLLGCGAVWVYYKPTFRRNVSPQYSGWKNYRFFEASDCVIGLVNSHHSRIQSNG
jgi:hypothetical protein